LWLLVVGVVVQILAAEAVLEDIELEHHYQLVLEQHTV
jgi:hypothetical protein